MKCAELAAIIERQKFACPDDGSIKFISEIIEKDVPALIQWAAELEARLEVQVEKTQAALLQIETLKKSHEALEDGYNKYHLKIHALKEELDEYRGGLAAVGVVTATPRKTIVDLFGAHHGYDVGAKLEQSNRLLREARKDAWTHCVGLIEAPIPGLEALAKMTGDKRGLAAEHIKALKAAATSVRESMEFMDAVQQKQETEKRNHEGGQYGGGPWIAANSSCPRCGGPIIGGGAGSENVPYNICGKGHKS